MSQGFFENKNFGTELIIIGGVHFRKSQKAEITPPYPIVLIPAQIVLAQLIPGVLMFSVCLNIRPIAVLVL